MKVPRYVTGRQLAAARRHRGYEVTRQAGCHMRLTAVIDGRTQHVTIPDHRPLACGTLAAILRDVASQLGADRDDLIRDLG